MTDHDGSRWYFPTYEGLYDAKHVRQMGQAIWLYGWMLARAHVAQDEGRFAYQHKEAGIALGVTEREIMRWFKTLQQYGYITTRARRQYHLEVEVTNWRPVAEWLDSRHAEESDKTKMSHLVSRPDTRPDTRPDKPVTSHIISIRLLGYEYPSGSGERASLAGAFAWALERLKEARNKQAALQAIYELCFGGEPPDYGYIGRTAKAVTGAGRLAEIMWQLATKPPTGDVMAYVLKVYAGKDRNNGHHQEVTQANDVWANVSAQSIIESNAIKGRDV